MPHRTEGIADMTTLSEGAEAPDFSLESDTGETVSLSQLRGKPVVLYFYPRDDTPGCTTEACEFRDAWAEVKSTGAVVLGVSPDTAASHKKFKSKFRLPFPLLADPDHKVAERYGAWGERSMYGRKFQGILRTTFVIGPDGRIKKVFERVKPKGHASQVLESLQ
jgi:thioredoxin-dependent peroxiredoxin